jgi:serine protease
MRQLLGSLFVAALISTAAEGQIVRRVPADYSTIQAAINAAVNGDTVRVAPGIYVENINFLGKAITVASEGGANVTTIDGNQTGPVVRFTSHEGSSSVLEGFTIRNGYANYTGTDGGGIIIVETSPIVRLNRIINNKGCNGPGVAIWSGSPLFQWNTISDNTTFGCSGTGGAGILIRFPGTPQILENVIANNFATNGGGGLHIEGGAAPLIRGNVITGNQASLGGGIEIDGDSLNGSNPK